MNKKCLGIFYSQDELSAILIEKNGTSYSILHSQSVQLEAHSDQDKPESDADDHRLQDIALDKGLASIAASVIDDKGRLPDTALALASDQYHIMDYHSAFENTKQIDETLRFDIEEEFLENTEETCICFDKKPTSEQGSDIAIYATNREQLSKLTNSFDLAGLDCLIVKPDIVAWSNYLAKQEVVGSGDNYLVLGRCANILYFIIMDANHQVVSSRSLMCPVRIPAEQYRSECQRFIVTLPEKFRPQKIYYHSHDIDVDELKKAVSALGMTIEPLQEEDMKNAIAMGVAISWIESESLDDFRADGLPPRSLMAKKQKAFIGLSASVSLLFLMVILLTGWYGARHEGNIDWVTKRYREIFKELRPNDRVPRSEKNIKSVIASMRNSLSKKSSMNSGNGLAKSASPTFQKILGVLVELPEKDLLIEKLQVSDNTAILSGSVADIGGKVELDKIIEKYDLNIDKWDVSFSENRRSFNISMQTNQEKTRK